MVGHLQQISFGNAIFSSCWLRIFLVVIVVNDLFCCLLLYYLYYQCGSIWCDGLGRSSRRCHKWVFSHILELLLGSSGGAVFLGISGDMNKTNIFPNTMEKQQVYYQAQLARCFFLDTVVSSIYLGKSRQLLSSLPPSPNPTLNTFYPLALSSVEMALVLPVMMRPAPTEDSQFAYQNGPISRTQMMTRNIVNILPLSLISPPTSSSKHHCTAHCTVVCNTSPLFFGVLFFHLEYFVKYLCMR